jgi:hypothetical protein
VHPVSFDPVPELAGSGTTISGSASGHLIPIKLGFFVDRGPVTIEVYGNFLISKSFSWTASGARSGTGTSTYHGYGIGFALDYAFVRTPRAKLGLVFNTEYSSQDATIDFSDGSSIGLHANSILAGVGIQPELWLADLWVLGLFAGYEYGFPKYWSASKAATFMGTPYATSVVDDSKGNPIHSNFGGFLASAFLKLNFY